jgi:RNA polymerase sigma-70 factor (ECF subfamily)
MRQAWLRELVRMHEARLVTYARRWVGGLADDLVQEAFLRLWRSEFSTGEAAAGWLYRVVRNLAIDEVRRVRASGQSAVTLSTSASAGGARREAPSARGFDPGDFGASEHVAPEDRMALTEGVRRVLEHLSTLPPRQQEIVRLRLVDGLSYPEIAQALGLTATNVGFILHTALAALRAGAAEVVPDFIGRRA